MGSVHIQCGREDRRRVPGGVAHWGPSLETGYHSCYFLRKGEEPRSADQVVPRLPSLQCRRLLFICTATLSPIGWVMTRLLHLQPHTLVTGRKKQSSKERWQHLHQETRAFPEIVSRFLLVSLLELCDGTTLCYKEVSEIQFLKLGLWPPWT